MLHHDGHVRGDDGRVRGDDGQVREDDGQVRGDVTADQLKRSLTDLP